MEPSPEPFKLPDDNVNFLNEGAGFVYCTGYLRCHLKRRIETYRADSSSFCDATEAAGISTASLLQSYQHRHLSVRRRGPSEQLKYKVETCLL
jgi:hypothetical protein